MLPPEHRLIRSTDFRHVQLEGQCWSNRILVLCKAPNALPKSRVGFSVSKRIGKAVVRNRAKRLISEAVRLRVDLISPGWDIVFIARRGIAESDYWAIERSVHHLLVSAHLLQKQARDAVDKTG